MKTKRIMLILLDVVLVLFICTQVYAFAEDTKANEQKYKTTEVLEEFKGMIGSSEEPWIVRLDSISYEYQKDVISSIKKVRNESQQTWRIFPCYGGSIIISNCSYTVQAGDTWASVASKYGLTQTQLKMMNVFYQSFELVEGMKVRVKWM